MRVRATSLEITMSYLIMIRMIMIAMMMIAVLMMMMKMITSVGPTDGGLKAECWL